MLPNVDPAGEQRWLDLTDPADRQRWDAAEPELGNEPLPLSAYRQRETSPVNSPERVRSANGA